MEIKFRNWDKKPRTLLRYIKVGDIFCFQGEDKKYYFGRIMTKNSLGHVAEFFCDALDVPDASLLPKMKRMGEPLIIDSYGLFDRKIQGDWRIVGHQSGYEASKSEDVLFTYGVAGSCKVVDIFDNESPIAADESKNFKRYSPMRHSDIEKELGIS